MVRRELSISGKMKLQAVQLATVFCYGAFWGWCFPVVELKALKSFKTICRRNTTVDLNTVRAPSWQKTESNKLEFIGSIVIHSIHMCCKSTISKSKGIVLYWWIKFQFRSCKMMQGKLSSGTVFNFEMLCMLCLKWVTWSTSELVHTVKVMLSKLSVQFWLNWC